MNFIFEVHLRRTTKPLGSRLNPEGSKIEPFWVRSRTQKGSIQKGSKIEPFWVRVFEPFWVRDQTQRVRSSNPLRSTNPEGFVSSNPSGFEIEPSGFHEPRGFETQEGSIFKPFWVRGTQRVRDRTQKGSISNPLGSKNEPSGFVELRGLEDRTLWVRSRTQKGSKIRTLLGSWNPEGSKIEPSGFEDTNPEGFDLRTLLGSRSNPEGFDLRTLWVRSRTQRVRRSSKMNFEDEVHLRRTKMNFKKKIFFFFLVEIGSPPSINNDGR
ncbi:hypothetical protein ACOSP7_023938 [Xanthoceras sorbifolium]